MTASSEHEKSIQVHFEGKNEQELLREVLIQVIKIASKRENRNISNINIVLTGDEILHDLNKKFRNKDSTTDVLSFDLSEEGSDVIEGDLYISLDQATAQAQDRSEPPEKEILRLAVHGFLHLCGWEHPDDVSLREMINRGEKWIEEVYLWKGIGS